MSRVVTTSVSSPERTVPMGGSGGPDSPTPYEVGGLLTTCRVSSRPRPVRTVSYAACTSGAVKNEEGKILGRRSRLVSVKMSSGTESWWGTGGPVFSG